MDADFLIIGGGIAGATAGYHLRTHGRVVVLEMESVAGYHSTGRSAALFSEYYGGPEVRALTAASRAFLTDPPPGFAETPLLGPRGVLALAPAGAEELFEAALAEATDAPVPAREIDPAEVTRHCPVVRPGWARRAMLKPGATDIDVDALHQGFLRGIRAAGGELVRSAPVTALEHRAGRWHARTPVGTYTGRVVVDAAGAWADRVAALAGVRPVGLVPRRRTAFLVESPVDVTGWPMVLDVAETFYFKPESGQLLVSPADATPVPPGDARPDELDVALGVERVNAATTLAVRHVKHAWAGLRTSVADDVPVIGAAPGVPGFCWVAGLGGYGVQPAPAVGRLAAALAVGDTPELDPAPFSPARFG
ncbi:MAG TPA: FAD-binding oxidoreductase [Micromonospora sp.]